MRLVFCGGLVCNFLELVGILKPVEFGTKGLFMVSKCAYIRAFVDSLSK